MHIWTGDHKTFHKVKSRIGSREKILEKGSDIKLGKSRLSFYTYNH